MLCTLVMSFHAFSSVISYNALRQSKHEKIQITFNINTSYFHETTFRVK